MHARTTRRRRGVISAASMAATSVFRAPGVWMQSSTANFEPGALSGRWRVTIGWTEDFYLAMKPMEGPMCESNVYVRRGEKEELVMENVAAVTPSEGGFFLLRGLLGEVREIKGTLFDINLMAHRIVFTESA